MKDCIHGSHNFPFTIVYSLYTIDPATALGEHLSRFFASRSVPGQNGKLTDTLFNQYHITFNMNSEFIEVYSCFFAFCS